MYLNLCGVIIFKNKKRGHPENANVVGERGGGNFFLTKIHIIISNLGFCLNRYIYSKETIEYI